ncbi:MAG: thioredoxin family protein [Deltaproteobacteria bacterium]|nr:thioredoxin family protein [Deltaproteobacteria bacterium]
MIRTKILMSALALAALLYIAPNAAQAVAVGSAAPDFQATDSSGKAQTLSQYKGKWVVLEWFNEGCPYVKKHYESDNMQKLQREAAKQGVVWLTVISSAPGKQGHGTPEQVNAKRAEWKIASAATLLDPEGKVGRLYEAKTTPHMFLIDPQGKVAYMGAIDDRPTSDPADIPASKNLVKVALDAAMAGRPVAAAATVPYGCSVKY